MTNVEKSAVLEQLAENKEFLQAISAAQSKCDIQKACADFGLEMTREEVDALVQMLNDASNNELNEDSLESVSGGVSAGTVFSWAWKGVKKVSKYAWDAGRKLANWEDRHYR